MHVHEIVCGISTGWNQYCSNALQEVRWISTGWNQYYRHVHIVVCQISTDRNWYQINIRNHTCTFITAFTYVDSVPYRMSRAIWDEPDLAVRILRTLSHVCRIYRQCIGKYCFYLHYRGTQIVVDMSQRNKTDFLGAAKRLYKRCLTTMYYLSAYDWLLSRLFWQERSHIFGNHFFNSFSANNNSLCAGS